MLILIALVNACAGQDKPPPKMVGCAESICYQPARSDSGQGKRQKMKVMDEHTKPEDFELALADIASEAGRVILEIKAHGPEIVTKPDDSPVTEADRRAEEIILAGLERIAGEMPVIAEEAVSAGRVTTVGERFFLVDPLDGTREFIDGRDEFTVNIALIESGRPVSGVVLAPALGLVAVAGNGKALEARLGENDRPGMAEWKPMSTRQVPADGPVALASRSHRDTETEAFLDRHGITDIRSSGSSLKFLDIARGGADVYPRFGRTMEWDTAAGHAVLSAAGGVVHVADGAELSYGKVAQGYANPPFIAWGRRPEDPTF